jgi:hypothetical protein
MGQVSGLSLMDIIPNISDFRWVRMCSQAFLKLARSLQRRLQGTVYGGLAPDPCLGDCCCPPALLTTV